MALEGAEPDRAISGPRVTPPTSRGGPGARWSGSKAQQETPPDGLVPLHPSHAVPPSRARAMERKRAPGPTLLLRSWVRRASPLAGRHHAVVLAREVHDELARALASGAGSRSRARPMARARRRRCRSRTRRAARRRGRRRRGRRAATGSPSNGAGLASCAIAIASAASSSLRSPCPIARDAVEPGADARVGREQRGRQRMRVSGSRWVVGGEIGERGAAPSRNARPSASCASSRSRFCASWSSFAGDDRLHPARCSGPAAPSSCGPRRTPRRTRRRSEVGEHRHHEAGLGPAREAAQIVATSPAGTASASGCSALEHLRDSFESQ